jgi:hypothetical protein
MHRTSACAKKMPQHAAAFCRPDRDQEYLRMNSPMRGATCSRQRRPEKMP